MARPKLVPARRRSRSICLRLRLAEDDALKQLAQATGQTPSQVLRQLLHIAATGEPDFCGTAGLDLRRLTRAVTPVGRTFNQLTRALNRGEPVAPAELRRVLDAIRVQLTVVHAAYLRAVRVAVRRVVVPLCEAAGLRSPFEIEAVDQATEGQPGRRREQPPQ